MSSALAEFGCLAAFVKIERNAPEAGRLKRFLAMAALGGITVLLPNALYDAPPVFQATMQHLEPEQTADWYDFAYGTSSGALTALATAGLSCRIGASAFRRRR